MSRLTPTLLLSTLAMAVTSTGFACQSTQLGTSSALPTQAVTSSGLVPIVSPEQAKRRLNGESCSDLAASHGPQSADAEDCGSEFSTQDMPEFGTVMTFPAGPATTEMAAVAESVVSKFQLTSTPTRSVSAHARAPMPTHSILAINQPSRNLPSPSQAIQTSVLGPESLIPHQSVEFKIEINNQSKKQANEIIVQMAVSPNITITGFDREAWLDTANRTISWKLDSLESGKSDAIRFRIVSATPGNHLQEISVGMNHTFQGKTGFIAHVLKTQPATPQQSAVLK